MTIQVFSCPKCGTHLRADSSYTGKYVRCLACQAVFAVGRGQEEKRHPGPSGGQDAEASIRPSGGAGTTPNPISLGNGFDSGDPILLESVVSSLIKGNHIFLTGAAGTGKTYLVKRIVKALAERRHTVNVTASTGIAASLLFDEIEDNRKLLYVRGPSTLHSAAMLPWSSEEDDEGSIKAGKRRLSTSDVVIIDEISMLDKLTFSRFLKRVKRPTGLLAVGDFYQLEPVRRDEKWDPDFTFHGTPFHSFELLELTNVYRQSNPTFVEFLERLRHGECDREFFRRIPEDFDLRYPVLFGTRREAAIHNDRQLATLDTPAFMCQCAVTVGNPEKALEWFANYTRAVQRLEIKQGMRILWIQNIPDPGFPGRCLLVNGDLGTIVRVSDEQWADYGPEWVEIDFDRIGRRRWGRYNFRKEVNDGSRKKVIFEVRQFPFVPAYGLTVHKAQGMTLDRVNIDGNRINFAAGQVYVALSRCRDVPGLRIQNSNMFEAFTRASVNRYYETAMRYQAESAGTRKNYEERLGEIKQAHPKAYQPWTSEEDVRLTERFRSGASVEQLAREFQRQPGAIRSRLAKLNLK